MKTTAIARNSQVQPAEPSAFPASVRWFRAARPAEFGPEPVHRVEIVSVVWIAGTTLAACRDRNNPCWYYEVLTSQPVKVGATGTVRVIDACQYVSPNRLPRFKPEWSLTLDESTTADPLKSQPANLLATSSVDVKEKAGQP